MARPTARVLALLELLQAGGVHPAPRLAARLGVDERTVRRFVEHLIELEIPVESVRGRYGGYRISPGFRLPPLMLTEDEAVVAVVGLSMATRIGLKGEASAARTAVAKIRRVLPAALGRRVDALTAAVPSTSDSDGVTTASSVLLTAAEAAHDGHPIRLSYVDRNGRASSRLMLPWGLVAHRGRWYVTGPDLKSGEHRTFRLDRVAEVDVERGRFDVPAGFDSQKQVLAAITRAPWKHEVSVLIQADESDIAAHLPAEIARLRSVPDEELRTGGLDGHWTHVSLRAERLEWVAASLAAIGAPFVVERPPALRDAVLALAQTLTAGAQAAPFRGPETR